MVTILSEVCMSFCLSVHMIVAQSPSIVNTITDNDVTFSF